jgi:subtilase family serine protease
VRLPRVICAAGSCALVMGVAGAAVPMAGAAVPVATGPASRPATVLIAPDIVRFDGPAGTGKPPTTAQCEHAFKIACYSPVQIAQAYGIPKLLARGVNGRGQTIVIVDSFGSPTIRHDLAVFDATYGLPAPPPLTIIQPAGPVPPYQPTSNREGWAGETSLDVEYAHAMAPAAKILLVETPTSENEGTTGFPQIVKAEEFVIDHHLGSVISQSFSATEQTFPTKQSLLALRGAYIDAARKNVTVLAASGDSGAADVRLEKSRYYLRPVTSWPDSDPLVTGVGGTQLHLGVTGQHTAPDQVWNDTGSAATNEFIFGNHGPNPLAGGGGRSVIFSRPAYQNGVRGVVGDSRGVPDIAMSGACNGAVNVYQSFKGNAPGWYQVCGTSEATPLFAGVVALADQVAGHPLGLINPQLYQLSAEHAHGLVDVMKGNNTVSFTQAGRRDTVRGFGAGPGYDLASGVGTIYAPVFVPELAGMRGQAGLRSAAPSGPGSPPASQSSSAAGVHYPPAPPARSINLPPTRPFTDRDHGLVRH